MFSLIGSIALVVKIISVWKHCDNEKGKQFQHMFQSREIKSPSKQKRQFWRHSMSWSNSHRAKTKNCPSRCIINFYINSTLIITWSWATSWNFSQKIGNAAWDFPSLIALLRSQNFLFKSANLRLFAIFFSLLRLKEHKKFIDAYKERTADAFRNPCTTHVRLASLCHLINRRHASRMGQT